MKLLFGEDEDGRLAICVDLSRRNLLALLHKLDMPGSGRTIYREIEGVDGQEAILIVRSEDDDAHYAEREAREMDPASEAYIRASDEGRN
jgi:hypothetical protein